LWCAVRAAAAGLSTVVVERGRLGQGASGGFLGALMPHQPIRWTDEKAFQLEALLSLETEIATLECKTGISCGYLRCGRLIPTKTERKSQERPAWRKAAAEQWPQASPAGAAIGWRILEATPDPDWLEPKQAALGAEYETLSARANPRQLIRALSSLAKAETHVIEGAEVTSLGDGSRIVLNDATSFTPGRVIVTAGHQTFGLLEPVTQRNLGRGVKGQAALMRPRAPIKPSQPILYFGGLYVIAHAEDCIAVGSTSETTFTHPANTTPQLDELIARAAELCPALREAEVIERWAGVRPNAVGRHPIIGPLPEAPRLIVATGGFKISFGIAHKMADAALSFVSGQAPVLPRSFLVETHYACADSKQRT
jgi:glycine oxidase